jgi:hypothetical protein
MIALRLTREVMTDSCSRGALELLAPDGETISRLFTIEKPFIAAASGGKAGEPFRSCIGPGVYTLSPFTRPNEDKVWVLSNPDLDVFKLDTDVPPGRQGKGRFLILIHAGNRARDVVGCIAPGLSHRKDADGTLMVTSSRDAMKVLHKALDGRRNLEIEIGNDPAVRVAPMVARPVAAAAHPLVSEPTPNLHNWLRVPQGSRLVIRLSGTTTKELVTGSGSIRSDKAASRVFSDAEVQPGPLVVQLNGQDSCSVLLNLQFPRRATAAVSAFVEAPDHTHVPVDYHEQFRRPQGSAETILFNVITV